MPIIVPPRQGTKKKRRPPRRASTPTAVSPKIGRPTTMLIALVRADAPRPRATARSSSPSQGPAALIVTRARISNARAAEFVAGEHAFDPVAAARGSSPRGRGWRRPRPAAAASSTSSRTSRSVSRAIPSCQSAPPLARSSVEPRRAALQLRARDGPPARQPAARRDAAVAVGAQQVVEQQRRGHRGAAAQAEAAGRQHAGQGGDEVGEAAEDVAAGPHGVADLREVGALEIAQPAVDDLEAVRRRGRARSRPVRSARCAARAPPPRAPPPRRGCPRR